MTETNILVGDNPLLINSLISGQRKSYEKGSYQKELVPYFSKDNLSSKSQERNKFKSPRHNKLQNQQQKTTKQQSSPSYNYYSKQKQTGNSEFIQNSHVGDKPSVGFYVGQPFSEQTQESKNVFQGASINRYYAGDVSDIKKFKQLPKPSVNLLSSIKVA